MNKPKGLVLKGKKNSALGAVSLFAEVEEMESIHVPDLPDLPKELKLKDEKEYTGFYITGHPLDAYRDELEGLFQLGRLAENPEDFDGKTVTIGGLITEKVDRLTKAKQEKNVHLNLGRFHRHRTSSSIPTRVPKKVICYCNEMVW